jgi:hypothetical protein
LAFYLYYKKSKKKFYIMCQMEYYHLAEKLKTIRIDIKALRGKRTTSIKEKIQLLKETNHLLREQNKLLMLRQEILSKKEFELELTI